MVLGSWRRGWRLGLMLALAVLGRPARRPRAAAEVDALDAIPAELREDDKFKGLVTGLEATGREVESVFVRHGIEKVKALGAMLDPNLHQAMVELASDEAPGTIIQEMQAGYTIKDRLLRPALVGVAKKAD